jgi:hypothetical protein
MKNKVKQMNTISKLIDALKTVQDKFGDIEVVVWDSNCHCEYDYDETDRIVNLIVKTDYQYVNDEDDDEKVLILKTE